MKSAVKTTGKLLIANLLPEDLFLSQISIERSKALFGAFVRHVEIENHNFCNRTCWFCPNSRIDRRSQLRMMSDFVFNKILNDLSEIDYRQGLLWTRFHEPLAHKSIFKRIQIARQRLPRAQLVAYSNGDYLNRESLKQLENCGLDRLRISLYLAKGKEDDPAAIQIAVNKFTGKTGLTVTPTRTHYGYGVEGSSMLMSLSIPKFRDNIFDGSTSSRGGFMNLTNLENYQRYATCYLPLHSIDIDYNGKGVLCCHTSSDVSDHKNAIIGDLNQNGYSLFHLYKDLGPFRAHLFSKAKKRGVCAKCNVGEIKLNRGFRNGNLSKRLRRLPGVQSLFDRMLHYYMKKRVADL